MTASEPTPKVPIHLQLAQPAHDELARRATAAGKDLAALAADLLHRALTTTDASPDSPRGLSDDQLADLLEQAKLRRRLQRESAPPSSPPNTTPTPAPNPLLPTPTNTPNPA